MRAALCQLVHAQILIGQTAGFTGPVGAGVKETTEEARLCIDATNANGGMTGQKIELISLDDKFEPKLAVKNARKLIEGQNVIAMFLTRGMPHTEAMIPLLEKCNEPLVGPSNGAMVFHQPVCKTIFNVCAPTRVKPKSHHTPAIAGHHTDCHRLCRRQFWDRWCRRRTKRPGDRQTETGSA